MMKELKIHFIQAPKEIQEKVLEKRRLSRKYRGFLWIFFRFRLSNVWVAWNGFQKGGDNILSLWTIYYKKRKIHPNNTTFCFKLEGK